MKLLYILTTETESSSLRVGKKLFTNKEIVFNTPEEAIKFINNEHPKIIAFDDEKEGGSIFDSIETINFSQPVKSIFFTRVKII